MEIPVTLEEIWYESSPYVYLLIGGMVLLHADGAMSIASGTLLLVAAVTIIRLRWRHRHALARAKASTGSSVPGLSNAAAGSRGAPSKGRPRGADHVR